jgi:hypothetical protein
MAKTDIPDDGGLAATPAVLNPWSRTSRWRRNAGERHRLKILFNPKQTAAVAVAAARRADGCPSSGRPEVPP